MPISYDMTIKTYVGPFHGEKSFTFEGTTAMHFRCLNATNKVVFHQRELNLTLVNFTSEQDPTLEITNPNFEFVYDRKDFVTGYFNKNCMPNATYTLTLDFQGVILDKLYGFYRSTFKDKNGVTHQ
jgi:hypothetical protein